MDPVEGLEAFIRRVMRRTPYHAKYVAVVQRQHDDDSLDLLPDDASIRGTGLSRVELRHGLPGVRVRVTPGSRVLLAFEAGNPAKPRATLWESGSIEDIRFDGGTAPLARVGDPVRCFWPPSVPFTGTVTIGGVPSAIAGTMTITSAGVGVIESGAERVKA